MSRSHVHDAVFTWPSTNPSEVILTGTFDAWSRSVRLTKTASGFSGTIKLPYEQSRVFYKYIIDGNWDFRWDQPYERDHVGNINNVYTLPPRPVLPPVEVGKQEELREASSKVEEVNAAGKLNAVKNEQDDNAPSKVQDREEGEIKEATPPSTLLNADEPASSSTGPEPPAVIPEVFTPAASSSGMGLVPAEVVVTQITPEPRANDHPEAVSSLLDTISKSAAIPSSAIFYSGLGLGTEPALEISSEDAAILQSLDKASVSHFEKKEDAEVEKIAHVPFSNTSPQKGIEAASAEPGINEISARAGSTVEESAFQAENLPDGVELSHILPTNQAQAVLSKEAAATPVPPSSTLKALLEPELAESEMPTIDQPSGKGFAPPAETAATAPSEPEPSHNVGGELFTNPEPVLLLALHRSHAESSQPETELANAASTEEVSTHIPPGDEHASNGINGVHSKAQEGGHANGVADGTPASFYPESEGETLTDSKPNSAPSATVAASTAATAESTPRNGVPESAPEVTTTNGLPHASSGNALTHESDLPTNPKVESPPAPEPRSPDGKPELGPKSSAPSPPPLVSTPQSAPSTPGKSNTQRFPVFGSPSSRRSTSSSTAGYDSGTIGSQRKKRSSFVGKLKHFLHIDEESKKEKAEKKEKKHRETSV